ncbi:hypothetical protein DOY81_013767 [Sarcophaga bullata]|nr:hypothetical protein DOY81_013767 [Sarcophaga bullata]
MVELDLDLTKLQRGVFDPRAKNSGQTRSIHKELMAEGILSITVLYNANEKLKIKMKIITLKRFRRVTLASWDCMYVCMANTINIIQQQQHSQAVAVDDSPLETTRNCMCLACPAAAVGGGGGLTGAVVVMKVNV